MYLFYYNQLNNEEMKIYWFIKDALFSLEPRIYINDSYIPTQRLKEISWMITLDYPELYWTKGSFEINEKTGDRELRPTYMLPKDDIDRHDDYIFSEISNISIGQRDIEEKICSVCNWMIENVRYDTDKYALKNKVNQTVLSVFVEKKSLCMGISKVFKLIAGLLDIESIIAIGDICYPI